jgi:hypothetical protein
MNPHIKELAEQFWDTRIDGRLHFDIEMFAELIVRDCCPQRPWVGLTAADIKEIWKGEPMILPWDMTRTLAIEAKLKEKNT